MNGDVLVSVENVSKKYCRNLKRSLLYGVNDIASELVGRDKDEQLRPGEFWAIKDVSFEVRRGDVLGLVGPNGAGKTTLLKLLNGLIKPDRGRITVRGHVSALIALGMGFNPILTGRENVYVNGSILGLKKNEVDARYDEIVEFAGVEEFMDTPVKSYSSGMRVRLGFAIAVILVRPDVLLLDEVLAVGDTAFRVKCINAIIDKMRHCAVVFVNHQETYVKRICSHGVLLFHGRMTMYSRNLGEIFARYNEQTRVMGSESSAEWLEYGVQVKSFSVNGAVEPIEVECETQDSLDIALQVSRSQESLRQCVMRVFAFSSTGEIRIVYEARIDSDDEEDGPTTTLLFNTEEIRLASGTYSVAVELLNSSDHSFLAKNENLFLLNVHAAWDHTSPVALDATAKACKTNSGGHS